VTLDRKRHRRARLAGADDQCPAARRCREMPRQDLERIGGGDGRVKTPDEQLFRFTCRTAQPTP